MNRLLVCGLSLFFLACSPAQEKTAESPAEEATVPSIAPDEEAQESSDPATAPSITIYDFDGLNAAVEARKGSGYLINFWAIWCAPCVKEMPELVHVAQRYRDQGGEVIGVSYDLMIPGDDAESILPKMTKFMERRNVDIPVWIYDDVDYEEINKRFQLPGEVPVTLAIDRDGKIVDREDGPATEERFDAMMRKALGK